MWGGETTNGIDCSGLARVALWQAMMRQGIREVNPGCWARNLWNFWWTDMSTADILRGKHGYTKVIGYAPKVAGYDTSKLKIGDMAVAGRAHVMIYCGKGEWIEASPTDGKVVVNSRAGHLQASMVQHAGHAGAMALSGRRNVISGARVNPARLRTSRAQRSPRAEKSSGLSASTIIRHTPDSVREPLTNTNALRPGEVQHQPPCATFVAGTLADHSGFLEVLELV